jgi:hypothetical protein
VPLPLDVAVEGRALGPLTVSVGAVSVAPANEARTWVTHDLTLTNESDSLVFVNDPRHGVLLGDRRSLLAAVGGCGYGLHGGDEPVTVACLGSYQPLRIEPHASHVLGLALTKELPGMPPLAPGEYVLKHTIRYRQDRPFDDPRETGSQGTIVVTYTVR